MLHWLRLLQSKSETEEEAVVDIDKKRNWFTTSVNFRSASVRSGDSQFQIRDGVSPHPRLHQFYSGLCTKKSSSIDFKLR